MLPSVFSKLIKHSQISIDKPWSIEQILTQVSRDTQFGKDNEITLLAAGDINAFFECRKVTGKIAGGSIYLTEANFHSKPFPIIWTSSRYIKF